MIQIKKSDYDYTIMLFSENKISSNTSSYEILTEEEKQEKYYFDVISRAKRTCIDYCKNNNFTHFVTISFDSSKVDISDIDNLRKRICKYFNNFKNREDKTFKYLIVPEYGETNGRLHFHGLVYQENCKHLKHLAYGDYREENLFNGFGACKWRRIKKFDSKLQGYISKYITKDLIRIYKCSYFCSKGLKRSKVIYISIRNTLATHKEDLQDRMVRCLVSWLEENKLFIHTEYCDFFTLTIKQYNDFIENHNLVVNRKFKQYTFNDLLFEERRFSIDFYKNKKNKN